MQLKNVFLIIVFFSQFLNSQNVIQPQSFVIQGKVLNTKEKSWRFGMTTFFDNKAFNVSIKEDGTFSSVIPIDSIQDIYLYLEKMITINACPGDTIKVYWDEKNFDKTLTLKSPILSRNNDLQTMLKLNRFTDSELNNRLNGVKNATDSMKFSWINIQYNKRLKLILEDSISYTPTTKKFICDSYYSYIHKLIEYNLLRKFSLSADTKFINPTSSPNAEKYLKSLPDYRKLSYSDFCISSSYRGFLWDYVNYRSKPFYGTDGASFNEFIFPFTQVKDDYYRVLANISLYKVRDWLATKVIISGFRNFTFEETELVYNDFMKICKTEIYKNMLNELYNQARPDKSAINFTLQDDIGKSVSLSDFLGKVVYIDFWGVTCGPCVAQIKNAVPQFHKKYENKDVVFINICVDSNVSSWKKSIANLKLKGVNLIAEGWVENKVCKDYGITGIPHYILIDKKGVLKVYNAPKPDELLSEQQNILDRLLEANVNN